MKNKEKTWLAKEGNETFKFNAKDFEDYLDKMGYSWNDFDRTYELANLIEQYADEKVKQALSIANVVGQSEQLVCPDCGGTNIKDTDYGKQCRTCFEFL